MKISKNWEALAIDGFTGYEIIVSGDVIVGSSNIIPLLERREPQGINPSILQLDLLNVEIAQSETFKKVRYNEVLNAIDDYGSVEIFHNNALIKLMEVRNG